MTLFDYFEKNWRRAPHAVIDHSLRIQLEPDGSFSFYIHPSNTGGDTVDFKVEACAGNSLRTKTHYKILELDPNA